MTSPRKPTLAPLAADVDKLSFRKRIPKPPFEKRVYFCGVVVEGVDHGKSLPSDVKDLIASLGDPMDMGSEPKLPQGRKRATTLSNSPSSSPGVADSLPAIPPTPRKRANTLDGTVADILQELIVTEQSYVNRIRNLKHDYADPLRQFARNKDIAILPAYEAKIMFGNIDQLLPVNEAWLADLEQLASPDGSDVGGIGDIALKHFRDLRGFEYYKQYYTKVEEAQAIYERESKKANTSFGPFIERIKYTNADTRNRLGLRELLMEPVQRIPRYTLLFQQIIKKLPADDPQRARLSEANDIANQIAKAEIDDSTKRAAIMYCLRSTIEDFPPALVSNSRKFIDCIDVVDILLPGYVGSEPMTPGGAGGPPSLHCSLLLFDDKLVIVKRPGSGEKGARALTGLDDVDRVTKPKALQMGLKKTGMACKGVVDVCDVVASDVGGSDFHLYLENPPADQTDRWAGRPFRTLSVVLPPAPVNLDPPQTQEAKRRFLQNLWQVQARYRTRNGQSVILCAEEREVENSSGRVVMASTFFNIYQRTAFLQETKKTKIVVHIDPTGMADPIDFGMRGPFVVVRVQPIEGELSRFHVTSNDSNDQGEEDILQTARVPGQIIQTIHRYAALTFRTSTNSVPSTPSVATTRVRGGLFDAISISKNLFHARPGGSRGDIFGGSINMHRRTKTAAAAMVTTRSSGYAASSSTGDSSSMSRFTRSRSNSVTTVPTSVDDDGRSMTSSWDGGSRNSRRSQSLSKKLIKKRPKSPGSIVLDESDSEHGRSPVRSTSRAASNGSRSRSKSPSSDWYTDTEDVIEEPTFRAEQMDQSERDLVARLELARKNSQTQHESGRQYPAATMPPGEETIYEYEDEPPQSLRSSSRASHPVTPTRSPFVEEADDEDDDERYSRPVSRQDDRRPSGPRSRSVSPLPPLNPMKMPGKNVSSVSSHSDSGMDSAVMDTSRSRGPFIHRINESIPRSRRVPFHLDNAHDVDGYHPQTPSHPSVEPLSIKRKSSLVVLAGSSPYRKRQYNVGRGSPLTKSVSRKTSASSSLRRTSSQLRALRLQAGGMSTEESEQLSQQSDVVKSSLASAQGNVKKLRTLFEQQARARSGSPLPAPERSMSPVKQLRSVWEPPQPPPTKEAQERRQEMLRLIGRRDPATRPLSFVQEESPRSSETSRDITQSTDDLAARAETDLVKAIANFEHVHTGLRTALHHNMEISKELVQARSEAMSQKRQNELVKSLMSDCMAEKDVMYESFNEELDKVFDELSLPEDEAWVAVADDLHKTKKDIQSLHRQNDELKIKMAQLETQNQTWASLLRTHGLIY